jgi:hypothetical protein
LVIVALASITVGCANVPKVDELGEAISATGMLFRGAVTANRTIALRIGEENQAYELLTRKPFTLADRPGERMLIECRATGPDLLHIAKSDAGYDVAISHKLMDELTSGYLTQSHA